MPGRSSRRTRVLLLLGALAAAPALAQSPPASGSVAGTVTDHLGPARPLRGAEVWIAGTGHRAVADDSGRYRVEGVPVGRYRITFFHALLDSLGVTAPIGDLVVAAGREARADLATPSGMAVFARACGRSPAAREGSVLGVVLDAERDAPVRGAHVAVSWVEFDVGDVAGRKVRPEVARRLARTTTDTLGQFVVCGVPDDVALDVSAAARGLETGVLPLSLEGRPFTTVQMWVGARAPAAATAAATATATAADAGATLVGRVRSPTGTPVIDAHVSIEGAGAQTRTDSAGRFFLRGLPSGSQPLAVRAIGFAPAQRRVVLRPGRADTVEVALGRTVATLATVNVTGRARELSALRGFEERRRQGFGSFLDEEQISRRRGISVMDLIRDRNGMVVRRDPNANLDLVFSYRRTIPCLVDVFVDGMYVRQVDGGITGMVQPSEVRAIEVYRGMETPGQFQRAMPPCGAVVIWTRAARGF